MCRGSNKEENSVVDPTPIVFIFGTNEKNFHFLIVDCVKQYST